MSTKASRASASGTTPAILVPGDRLDAFDHDLRRLVGTIRSTGARPVLVVHQNRFGKRIVDEEEERWLRAWERFYPRYTGEAILEFDRLAAARTTAIAIDSAVLIVDPTAALRDAGPVVFADFSHFNDRGAALLAGVASRALAPALCKAAKGGRTATQLSLAR